MKEIINNLFNYHNFKKIDINKYNLFFKDVDSNIRYYWLIIEVEVFDSELILAFQDVWFEECKKKINDKDFDKNTSLLIIYKRVDFDIAKQHVFKIEEDPFQFKKYVLTYTDDSLGNLKAKIENDNSEMLLNLLVDENIFNEYKDTHQNHSWHNLLYNIAHKLPFLKINVESNQNLENLYVKSKDEIKRKNLADFFDSFNEAFLEDVTYNLDKINEDELIELLNFNKDNGN